jgi:hypothetical protein
VGGSPIYCVLPFFRVCVSDVYVLVAWTTAGGVGSGDKSHPPNYVGAGSFVG